MKKALYGLYYLSCLDALCTDSDLLGPTINERPDPLEVWQPTPLGMVVGMTYIATHYWSLPTYITTSGHVSFFSFLGGFHTRQRLWPSIPDSLTIFKDLFLENLSQIMHCESEIVLLCFYHSVLPCRGPCLPSLLAFLRSPLVLEQLRRPLGSG